MDLRTKSQDILLKQGFEGKDRKAFCSFLSPSGEHHEDMDEKSSDKAFLTQMIPLIPLPLACFVFAF
ncbi:hypothetical protein AVEN_20851-1 [Araneus ventricosus]|uniref:Uncharacterized protein n=1 Tax=Araneus ventricosus TaxID=182803 RepID=A0A4Y2IAX0_ARAVE|nr:hypothetical protein AVEN_20851-1 [Araneus ventricosus]